MNRSGFGNDRVTENRPKYLTKLNVPNISQDLDCAFHSVVVVKLIKFSELLRFYHGLQQ